MRPRVRALLDEHGSKTHLVTLTSRRQATRFLARLTATAAPKPGLDEQERT